MEEPDNIEITAKKVDESLRRLHKDEAYTVFMMKSILESIGQVLTMIKFAIGGIVQMIFMLESGLLGFVSGLIGITIGAGISILISTLGSIPIAVTWTSLAIGLLFGVITTTVAGVYPANKAARLDPVEALRAE